MGKRLITLKTIQAEKLDRSYSHIKQQISDGKFPKPLDTGTCGPNLWEEAAIDNYIEDFIAAARARAAQGYSMAARHVAVATAARLKKREGLRLPDGQSSCVVMKSTRARRLKEARKTGTQQSARKEGA